jgi:hypothetical protein
MNGSQHPKDSMNSFQQLMEAVMLGNPNVLVYGNDLLVHSKTHEEHLEIPDMVFTRFKAQNLKINLPKCFFVVKMSVI